MDPLDLSSNQRLFVKQIHEIGEWIGFETRNKYQIVAEDGTPVAFAAEQQKGIFGFLLRQYLGHWRTFDVHFFSRDRKTLLVGHHPFRWFFERIELNEHGKRIGAIQKRFSILSKRFDVENERGRVILEVSSPIWRIWSFVFRRAGRDVASVKKRWSGLLSEAFTDRDNFLVEFGPEMTDSEKKLVMASAIFIDLLYFERKR